MNPYYSDPHLTILEGDSRAVLATLEPESVHCVVTSPPYWGLRDYGTASWEGGDAGCDHKQSREFVNPKNTLGPNGHLPESNAANQMHQRQYRSTCGKCGATRQDSQLGLEPTPEAYVEALVGVFREVRRVLRSDGTVWLNLGDSYAGGGGFAPDAPANQKRADGDPEAWGKFHPAKMDRMASRNGTGKVTGLKPKDLVGIPWRVAFALQADGWYLRSDVIWSKPNPMPESVTDRPTKSHEYLFLLSKSARYFFDNEAVAETSNTTWNPAQSWAARQSMTSPEIALGVDLVRQRTRGFGTHHEDVDKTSRNIRSVWTVATQPYPGAHFATFPEALVEPCVKAGTSERGVCPECGAPWTRVVERQRPDLAAFDHRRTSKRDPGMMRHDADSAAGRLSGQEWNRLSSNTTTGWRPSCAHTGDPVPAVVMDCFAGTGTVGLVAQRLSRRAVLIDLNAEYLSQCLGRNRQVPLGLGA